MNRYEELKGILQERRYFKVVCGAGNEDPEEVRLLSMIYTLAGASGIVFLTSLTQPGNDNTVVSLVTSKI